MIKEIRQEDLAECVQVLRKWYEKLGFVHVGTQKFEFFPFTCGYMEKVL